MTIMIIIIIIKIITKRIIIDNKIDHLQCVMMITKSRSNDL